MENYSDLSQSNLWQIPAPEGLYNKTFNDLFLHLLEKGLVALALYRLPGATDNKFPYVWTNPESATITNQDRVFVLADKIPKDLNLNSEDLNAMESNNFYRNQYNIFGNRSDGEIVKNYYGEEPTDREDSKYESEEDSNSDDNRSVSKSGNRSPKVLFSKLGDHSTQHDKGKISYFIQHEL
jgi:hypothetical protein